MSLLTVLIIATLALLVCFVVLTGPPLLDMFKNRLLYRSYLSRSEQAIVEKKLSRLSRVIVMCDRVDPPERGFLSAVKDNFSTGVKYVFLVSNRAAETELDQYVQVFENIEAAVRAEKTAYALIGDDQDIISTPLFEVHRLDQDWNDYPYICYEFAHRRDEEASQFLMYRGNELGVGIASEYVRIPPEIAYSLVKRADALKRFIGSDRELFVEAHEGNLENLPIENVLPFGRRSGTGRSTGALH